MIIAWPLLEAEVAQYSCADCTLKASSLPRRIMEVELTTSLVFDFPIHLTTP